MYTGRCLSALTQCSVFDTTSEQHLTVGHTHEDIDALLSLCKTALDSWTLETPRDVQKCLQTKLATLFAKKNMDLDIEIVQTATCLLFLIFFILFFNRIFVNFLELKIFILRHANGRRLSRIV